MADVKSLDLTIECKNTDNGVKQLLQEIRPTWQWTNVEKKILSGGYSCVMLRCYEKDNREDSVTIRIRNLLSSLGDLNKLEMKALSYLAEIEFFPDLIATFNNGYCYRYIKGKPAINFGTGDVTLHDTLLRKSAHKMAFLHTIKIPDTDMNTPTLCSLFQNMITISEYVPFTPSCPTKEALLNECSVLQNFCKEMKARVGLCHGDCHPGNMVWNSKNETITFVDWEIVHVGFQYSDIAHFIGSQTLWRELIPKFAPNFDLRLIPETFGDDFCKYYYEAWCRLQHQEMTETELENFKETVKKFKLCDAFLTVMFMAIVPKDAFEFVAADPEYYEGCLEVYLNYKKNIIGRKQFG